MMNIDEKLDIIHGTKILSLLSMGFILQNASEDDSSDSDQNNEKNSGSLSSSSSER